MERTEIIEKLTTIFRSVFKDSSLVLRDDMVATDVPEWNSMSYVEMLAQAASVFNIKFKMKDLANMQNVGDLINVIENKLK